MLPLHDFHHICNYFQCQLHTPNRHTHADVKIHTHTHEEVNTVRTRARFLLFTYISPALPQCLTHITHSSLLMLFTSYFWLSIFRTHGRITFLGPLPVKCGHVLANEFWVEAACVTSIAEHLISRAKCFRVLVPQPWWAAAFKLMTYQPVFQSEKWRGTYQACSPLAMNM